MKIALDAMGGDHAPAAEVEGAALAIQEYGLEVVLVGDKNLVTEELRRQGFQSLSGLTVHHASQRVEMHERRTAINGIAARLSAYADDHGHTHAGKREQGPNG